MTVRSRPINRQLSPAKAESTVADAAADMIGGDRRRRPRERDLLWAAFTTTQNLVVGCDAAGVITLANPALRRFAGLALAGPPPQDWEAYGIAHASNA
ncbi:MAG: hypothetical protein ACYDD0_11315, partial [Candidatus Dormibacteria bacterium]